MCVTEITSENNWQAGLVPVAVIMISLNEAHYMRDVLENLKGWAQEVFLVDSYSADQTVEIAREYGVHVIQRKFEGFGDQWNFAISRLPIRAPWTMKLDPDERISGELKENIALNLRNTDAVCFSFNRRLWFMGRPLPIRQRILRVWKTGAAKFTDVKINEHPIVDGKCTNLRGDLEHLDSPTLHHWIDKQNRYSTIAAMARARGDSLAARPNIWGSTLERRMWFKKNFSLIPFRYQLLFIVYFFQARPWITGRAGLSWARLRVWVRRTVMDKTYEIKYSKKQQYYMDILGNMDPDVK